MNGFKAAFAGIGASLFVSFTSAASAQDSGEIREVINNRPVDLKCSTFFPGLPNDTNPAPEKIALIGTAVYHFGQMNPTQYALMSAEDRTKYWNDPNIPEYLKVVREQNRESYEDAASRYDHASNQVLELKKILGENHPDFPISRWDKLARRCTIELD